MRVSKAALLLAAVSVTTPALAQPADEAALAPVKAFVAAIDADNVQATVATMTADPSITDEFAPFHWQGTGAVATWFAGLGAFSKANNVTDASISIDKPVHLTVEGDHGYAVVPMHFVYKVSGKGTTENALFTVSLVKTGDAWLMSAWTYALQ